MSLPFAIILLVAVTGILVVIAIQIYDDAREGFIDMVMRVRMATCERRIHRRQARQSWDTWFDAEGVSGDFMNVRDQPAAQHRRAF